MSSMAEIEGQAVSARVIYCTLAHWCERGLVEHTCATKPATKKARPHNKCLLKKPIQIASLELSPFYMHFLTQQYFLDSHWFSRKRANHSLNLPGICDSCWSNHRKFVMAHVHRWKNSLPDWLVVGNHGFLWLFIQLGMECHHPNWR